MKITLLTLTLCVSGLVAVAQSAYQHDRVYTANQVSNSISVVDPSTNQFLGEIKLGKPYPNVLSPLYKGQALVHGLRYSPERKMLAAVAIGSNSVTLISTETNQVLKTIYVGRSPHEPTFTPNSKQIWTSVRGEAYISVIDVDQMAEVKRVSVADGPGMVSFSPDGKLAYVCSSFTPEVDVVNTADYKIVKKILVVSPFSPNIFTSPKGEWVALTHKDVGKVTVINTRDMTIAKVLNTGPITNHVTFTNIANRLMMLVTVGGENKVRIFDVADGFKQTDTVNVGVLPHGLWPTPDGKKLYVGLEFGDQVQCIDLLTMKIVATMPIGQSPQALVYADNAVSDLSKKTALSGLDDTTATQVVVLKGNALSDTKAGGRLAIRSIGLIDLVEQSFNFLKPNTEYTLALSRSATAPYSADYIINTINTDDHGKYMGQSTGITGKLNGTESTAYKHVVLIDNSTKKTILIDNQLKLQ